MPTQRSLYALLIFSLLLILSSPADTEGPYAYTVTEGLYTYTVCDGQTTITDYFGPGGAVSIPASLGGYPVTSIVGIAFAGDMSLTSAKRGTSFVKITHSNCPSVTSITIPSSLTETHMFFSLCSSLTNFIVHPDNPAYASRDGVLFNKDFTFLLQCPPGFSGAYTIPDSVTSLKNYSFSHCSFLTSVTIPASVTEIYGTFFFRCSSLTNITVHPDNPEYASRDGVLFNKDFTFLLQCPPGFSGAYIIPDSVEEIGENAFVDCVSLTSVTVPDSVEEIGDCAFAECKAFTSFNIGNRVTSIGQYAFSSCTSLTSVSIPDSVTFISRYAFWGCDKLTSVTIPDSVTEILCSAFRDCTSLTNITVHPNNPEYASRDGLLFNKDFTVLIQWPGGRSGDYTIPASVTSIADTAFPCGTSHTSPTSVTIPAPGSYDAFSKIQTLLSEIDWL
jgi:hypothetical protein